MQSLEFIAVCRERIEEPLFVEALCQSKILALSRHAVEIGEHFAHPAVLHQQRALHLLFAQRVRPTLHPAGHLLDSFQRLFVAGQRVHVEMPGHDFVNRVERSPNVHAITQPVKQFLRERAEIATLVLRLALGQFSDHKIAVAFEFFVARTGESQCASRKVVSAGEVATKFAVGLFPITQWLCRRRKPSGQAERVQQPVGGQRLQIFPISLCCGAKGSRLELHTLQGKWNRLRRNHLAAQWFCRGSGTGTGPRVLKGKRGCTKNRGCTSHCGRCDKLTTAEFLHIELLPLTSTTKCLETFNVFNTANFDLPNRYCQLNFMRSF